jgi:hypothetical protein
MPLEPPLIKATLPATLPTTLARPTLATAMFGYPLIAIVMV